MVPWDQATLDDIFRRVQAGDPAARNELFEILNDELRARADQLMRAQPLGHTLQATALVNEAFLKLFASTVASWTSCEHVLATASGAMRHVLIDHARRKRAQRRTAGGERVPLDYVLPAYEASALDLVALDDALRELASFDPEMARVFEMRFFAGRDLAEIATCLGLPLRTLQRRFKAAKAWLLGRIT